MRSHYDEFAASETNKMNSSSNNNHNNNNTNNYNYNYSNGAIPYHARENSLPFSYGQISKTSTPLRPTNTSSSAAVSRSYKNGVEHDLDFDFDFGLSSGRNGGGLDYGKTSNGLNGSGKDVNYNLTHSAKTTTTTSNSVDRANKRSQFFGNGGGSVSENLHPHLNERGGGGVGCTQTLRYKTTTSSAAAPTAADETDASMIKVQPRLTSPLLVRKTLSSSSTTSRSPTRSTTNTIANTYHYSYGNKNSSGGSGGGGGGGGIGDNFDKFGVNGNINNKNDSSYYGHNTAIYGAGAGGDTLTKTPARHDFDELLRERREKVFNEYRSTTQEIASPSGSPLPPPRRFVNGTVQLPSTLPPSLKHNGSGAATSQPPQVPQRSQSQNGKYNYDFQFNLNLDDHDEADDDILKRRNQTLDRSPQRHMTRYQQYQQQQQQLQLQQDDRDNDDIARRRNQTLDRSTQRHQTNYQQYQQQPQQQQQDDHDDVDNIVRRRAQTLDRSPQRQTTNYQQYQQQQRLQQLQRQQQQLYQTRDIPLASYNVERNYHTSSSSTHAKNNNNNYYSNDRETLSPSSMVDIYATPYDDERSHQQQQQQPPHVQPLEATTTTSTLRTKRSDYSPYGNGNMFTQHEQQHANIGQPPMTDRESSPIYATSTKKVTSTTSAYRSNASQQQQQQQQQQPAALSTPMAATSMTTLTVTDYPSPSPTLRPETPAFPVTPRTPFAGGSSTTTSSIIVSSNGYNTTPLARPNGYLQHQQQQMVQPQNAVAADVQNYSTETIYGTNYRPRLNSSLSMANSEPQEVAAHLVKFAKDSSKFWYKPNLSREEAISLLVNAAPGTFVVRDSTTYKNAYGLVLRVSQPPPGTAATGKPDELVRHFLIEPTTRGVRLKGCANEPVFTSLSALVYEHSINQLALPCLLEIPGRDIVTPLVEPTAAQTQLLTQGAACNVLWLFSCDTESLTGEEAIRKAIRQMYAPSTALAPTEVHFKVSHQGITLTDNTRKKFFRKHYTADIISFCAIDPDHRLWTMQEHGSDNTTVVGALKKTIFAFVARRSASSKDNQCHVFCDLAINQPASAIVSFVNKTLPTEKQRNYVL